jgi:hypothetical protein
MGDQSRGVIRSTCAQGAQTKSEGEDFRRDLRERVENPDLGGADCYAADQVSAAPGYLRLVTVEFGGIVAPATVRLPRLVDLVERSLPTTADTDRAARTVDLAARLSGQKIWTAETISPSKTVPLRHFGGANLDSIDQRAAYGNANLPSARGARG